MAQTLGKGIRQIKDASQDIQDEIRKTSTDMKRDLNVNKALHDAKKTIEAPLKDFTQDLKASATEVDENVSGILNNGGEKSIEKTFQAPFKEFSEDLKDSAAEIEKNINTEKIDIPKPSTTDLSEDKNEDRKPDQENII